MVRTESGLVETSWNTALDVAGRVIREAMESGGASSIGLLGGARGSNEDAFAWAQLADAIGIEYRDAQFGDGLPVEVLGLPRATIDDAANAATIVLLGPDLKEELPVLFLRLRDAVEKKRSKIIEFTSVESGLSTSRLEVGALRTGHLERRRVDHAGRRRRRRAVGERQRRDRRRTTEPRRAGRCHDRRAADAARRHPRRDRAACVPSRQRRRRPVGRPRTGRRRPRRAGDPAGRRRRQARPARAARCRPDQRLPRCRPGAPRARRCPPDHLDRHVPVASRRNSPTSCSPPRRSARRPAPRPTSRVGSPRSPSR